MVGCLLVILWGFVVVVYLFVSSFLLLFLVFLVILAGGYCYLGFY